MSYLLLKQIHLTCVTLSGLGFFARGVLMLKASPLLDHPWVRWSPHVVDTLLLASATGLALTLHQYPFVHAWLTAKVTGLLAYIVLGSYALRRARTRALRIACWLAALAVFGYIVSVAHAHDPRGVFAPS